MAGSEAAQVGSRLRCARCGTELNLRQIGGGRVSCCDAPMQAVSAVGEPGGSPHSARQRVRCDGCGNEAVVERKGEGSLECCNRAMSLS